jgi:hypothetical protein
VARGGDGGSGRLWLGEGDRTAVWRRVEPAACGGCGRPRRARAGAAGRRRRRAETERVRGEKEEERSRARSLFSLFAECPRSGTRQRFFLFLKYALSSARSATLGKGFFAECRLGDTRQRLIYTSLPSATQGALGKEYFAECHQLTLGKVHLYFFCFDHQTFCGLFLHYVDLHVPFGDNYNCVCNI